MRLHSLIRVPVWRQACAAALLLAAESAGAVALEAPARLSQTGLYRDIASLQVADDVRGFSPQYPLWSDGARKQRWIRLPPGEQIDARQPDAWMFPVGTRLWKEFSLAGRLETRLIERLASGDWRFATYVWRADGSDADLAPASGVVREADAHGPAYAVPSRNDCLACHDGAPSPVLGFSALQLSADRDPYALHAEAERGSDLNLRELIETGRLVGWRGEASPRIQVSDATARSALGYLHGNCGHCHHRLSDGAVPVDLDLFQQLMPPDSWLAPVPAALQARSPRYLDAAGRPQRRADWLLLRMASTHRTEQMPPIGRHQLDQPALALMRRWLLTEQPLP